MSTTAPRADAAAAAVGARDLFVLRRVTGNQFVHFGGSGRGAGWAGLIEVSTDEEASLGEALATRSTVRLAHGGKELVFGPYYAHAAAFVPVTNDVVVVFGAEDDALETATDDSLTSAAHDGGRTRSNRSTPPSGSPTSSKSSRRSARPRSCTGTTWRPRCARSTLHRGGVALVRASPRSYLAEGERLVARRARLGAAAPRQRRSAPRWRGVLEEPDDFPYCVRTRPSSPLPAPLDDEPGIRSYYLLELTGLGARRRCSSRTPTPAPRGFTLLCRRLGLRARRCRVVACSALGSRRSGCSERPIGFDAEFGEARRLLSSLEREPARPAAPSRRTTRSPTRRRSAGCRRRCRGRAASRAQCQVPIAVPYSSSDATTTKTPA